jgi:hypothetical protein
MLLLFLLLPKLSATVSKKAILLFDFHVHTTTISASACSAPPRVVYLDGDKSRSPVAIDNDSDNGK